MKLNICRDVERYLTVINFCIRSLHRYYDVYIIYVYKIGSRIKCNNAIGDT